MGKASVLRLEWKRREGGGGGTQRDFLDFVVDDEPLSKKIGGDLASCLGWFVPEENTRAIRRLLLEEPADCAENRRILYVCPECGDLGCGAVTAVVEEVADNIIWRDFGFQNNYENKVIFGEYKNIAPIRFDKSQYHKVLRGVPQTTDD